MGIIAHGIDLVDFPRIEEMVKRHGERFLERVFTAAERAYAEANKNTIYITLDDAMSSTRVFSEIAKKLKAIKTKYGNLSPNSYFKDEF